MARSVMYRVVSPQGPIQRATGTVPFVIPGLANGVQLEFDQGDGIWRPYTPVAAFNPNVVLFGGDTYITTTDRLADSDQFLFHACFYLTSAGRDAIITWENTVFGVMAFDNYLIRGAWLTDVPGNYFFTYQQADLTTPEWVHLLCRGYPSGGQMLVDMQMWRQSTGVWNAPAQGNIAGTTFPFSSRLVTLGDVMVFWNRNVGTPNRQFNGQFQCMRMWTGISPDISLPATRDLLMDGPNMAAPGLAEAQWGVPPINWYGDAPVYNTPNHPGGLLSANMSVIGAVTDV